MSRTRKLSQETRALYLAFDLLTTAADKKLFARPLRKKASGARGLCKKSVQIQSDVSAVTGNDKLCDRPEMAGASRWRMRRRELKQKAVNLMKLLA